MRRIAPRSFSVPWGGRTAIYDYWRDNCGRTPRDIAEETGKDEANVRKSIRKAKALYPDLPWRQDPRHKTGTEPASRTRKKVKVRQGSKVATVLEVVAGDFHVPYHDPASVGCLLGYLKDAKPDGFTINGDFLDMYACSSFSKDPKRELQLQDELDEANELLDRIDAVLPKTCTKRFVIGNHEIRLERYLREHARSFHGLRALTIDAFLRLSERGYDVIPMVGRDASTHIGKVEVGHFNVARKDSGASARTLLIDRGCSVIQSHTHKLAAIYKRSRGSGEQHAAWEIGCMCDLSPEYVGNPDWMNGFATITKCEGSPRYHVALHEILGGELLAGGKRY